MSQGEVLRMVAEVQDRSTGPLGKIKAALASLKPGPGVKDLRTAFDGVHRSMERVQLAAAGNVRTSFAVATLGAVSLTAALAGVGTAMTSFGRQSQELQGLSKRSFFDPQVFREFQFAAARFNVNNGEVEQGLTGLSDTFQDIARRSGAAYATLFRENPRLANQLHQLMAGRENDPEAYAQALGHVIDAMSQLAPRARQSFSELLTGSKAFANFFEGANPEERLRGFQEELGKARQRIGIVKPEEVKAGNDFSAAMIQLQQSLDALKQAVVPALDPVRALVDQLTAYIGANREGISNTIANNINVLATELGRVDWADLGNRLSTAIKNIGQAIEAADSGVQKIGGWTTVFAGLIALPLVPLAASFVKLAAAITTLGAVSMPAWLVAALSNPATAAALMALAGGVVIQETRKGTAAPEEREKAAGLQDQETQLRRMLERPDLSDAARARIGERLAEIAEQTRRSAEALKRLQEQGYDKPAASPESKDRGFFDWLFSRSSAVQGVPNSPLLHNAAFRVDALPPSASGGRFGTGDALLDLISRAEGTTRRGYDDSYNHQVQGTLTDKTVAQIREIQRGMTGSTAIGRYQFMAGTLDDLMRRGMLSPDERFTPEVQDRIARQRLTDRGFDDWRNGMISTGEMLNRLAKEWASLPTASGQGHYPGQRAAVEIEDVTRALRNRPPPVDWTDVDRKSETLRRQTNVMMGGTSPQSVEGNASLRITLDGFPRGTRTSTSMDGLFKEIRLNRGRMMTFASEEA